MKIPVIQHVRDFGLLRGAALAAATVISFEAESVLAMLVGVSHGVSYAMPIAIDALMIASLRSRRRLAITLASLLMAGANAASHLLTDDAHGTDSAIIAAVSVVPVVVIMLLELLVPAVSEKDVTQPETVTVPHPVAHYVPVTLDETYLAALAASVIDEAEAVTQAEAVKPKLETPRLSDDAARRMAEDAYAAGESARAAAPAVTRSPATVSRWYQEFAKQGVKQLATTK